MITVLKIGLSHAPEQEIPSREREGKGEISIFLKNMISGFGLNSQGVVASFLHFYIAIF